MIIKTIKVAHNNEFIREVGCWAMVDADSMIIISSVPRRSSVPSPEQILLLEFLRTQEFTISRHTFFKFRSMLAYEYNEPAYSVNRNAIIELESLWN